MVYGKLSGCQGRGRLAQGRGEAWRSMRKLSCIQNRGQVAWTKRWRVICGEKLEAES